MRSPAQLAGQENEYPTEDSDPLEQGERRTRLRFPFELRVRFRSMGRAYPVAGAGWVRNISSGGVLVMYPHEVSAGTTLELSIEWPTRLDGRIPLHLVAVGTVLRSELCSFAVVLERYQFRIAGKQDLASDESFKAGA
jgi:PilZ domain-containing protein